MPRYYSEDEDRRNNMVWDVCPDCQERRFLKQRQDKDEDECERPRKKRCDHDDWGCLPWQDSPRAAEPWAKKKERENCKCEKHPRPKKILLECGFRPEDAIFETEHGYVREHQSFVLDRVLVDTSCFCKPLVKIEFSSLVFFEAKAKEEPYEKELEVELLFELIRICDREEEVLQNWKFVKKFEAREQPSGLGGQPQLAQVPPASSPVDGDGRIEVKISEPFTVTFCDKVCPDCCTYKMKVIGKDFKGKFEALRVVKPDLSALAQDSVNECCESSGD